MKEYTAENIKNVAIVGHGRCGKTDLVEAMLYRAGLTDRLGKSSEGNTVCDFDPEEIKRKVSISSSIAPIEHKDVKLNIIDTPGLFDFVGGMYEGIRAVETSLICVSGKSGSQVGTMKAFKASARVDMSRIFVVTKLDSEHADFFKVLDGLRNEFGKRVCPIIIPFKEGNQLKGFINVINETAYVYDDKGNPTKTDVPADMADTVAELTGIITEAVAETDDGMMDKFFAGEKFTDAELRAGIKKATRAGDFYPVIGVSAYTLMGVQQLLDYLVSVLPSAAEGAGQNAKDKEGNEVLVPCSDTDPLSAFVFKTVADPFVGKLSFIKVVSGRLRADAPVVNERTGAPEKLGKLVLVRGKKQEEVKFIAAGDIGAAVKLPSALTGDSLCDPARILHFAPVKYPKPSMSLGIRPVAKGDESKIASGLTRLMEEDPALGFLNNSETRQQVISGLGDQHLDVVVSKLKSKFGVDVKLEPQIIPYRETIRGKIKVEGKHKKQSGGHGQYGHVWIEFEPYDGEELSFHENVFGGAVPKNYFPAVEKGLQESVKRGTLAGYPVVGLKATLLDGSYHPVDSSEMAFKIAAQLAYKTGIPQAKPILLEPIGTLKAYVPDANTGDLMGELNKRRGRVLGMNPVEGDKIQEVVAEVPMSEMGDFTTFIRSLTQGRGYFDYEFVRYEPLPEALSAGVIEKAKDLVGEEKE